MPERLAESLAAAEKAQKMGKTSAALEELDEAVRLEPGSKLPWLRKAQIHFDARQYGQAITAAQEVLQRDAADLTAKSILAVSGLRVSAQALEELRKANEVSGSARTEAESVARIIREALGEPILVPPPAPARAEQAPVRRPARRAAVAPPVPTGVMPASPSAPSARPAAAPARSATPVPPVKAAMPSTTQAGSTAPASRGNPFGALQ